MTTRECEKFSFTRTGYMILRTTETTTRTASGKSWRAHPDTVRNEIITPEHYTNIKRLCRSSIGSGMAQAAGRYATTP